MGKRDDLYLLKEMVEYDDVYVEKATGKKVQERLNQGKESKKQSLLQWLRSPPPWKIRPRARKAAIAAFSK